MSSISLTGLANNKSRISQLEERLDDIELEQLMQKVRFSGSFFNHFEHLESSNLDTVTKEKSTQNLTPLSMKVALNIDVNITDAINFYSSLGMSKIWNYSGRDPQEVGKGPQYTSMRGSYGYKDSSAYFDTAYLSYHFKNEAMFLAIGRMTTNNGPPIEQLDGTNRAGTYPRFAYNAIFDGIAFIYDFKSFLPKDHSFKARAFYTPFNFVSLDSIKKNEVESSSGEQIESVEPQAALLLEYSVKNLGFAKSIDLYSMVWNYEKFYEEEFQVTGNDIIETSSANSYTIYLGVNKFLQTGLNFNYSYYSFKERFTGLEDQSSFNYMININYEFDNRFNANHILGFEYINTDDIYYLEDHNSLYFSDFYTRHSNNGFHIYYTVPVGRSQIIRVGLFDYKAGITDWNEDYETSEVRSFYSRWKVFF